MDIESDIHEKNIRHFSRASRWLKGLMEKLEAKVIGVARMTKKLAEDDPRRLIHSLKTGLALTLVSLFYYFQTLYDSFGASAMCAVTTVAIVFEFSVGATIGKGLNRALATLVAGALGVGVHYLAIECGKIGEPIILGIFVFLQAGVTTFVRFFPKIKARYDYGMLIFILTYSLVSVSSFRINEIVEVALKRLSGVAIGASICVIVSMFLFPVWAGEDLQNLVALNIEKLGIFLQEFGEEYYKASSEQLTNEKTFMLEHKSVLNSQSIEETLANFARWEPGHGGFMYRHPWKHYLKVGALTRQCAYRIDALNAFLNSHIQLLNVSSDIRIRTGDMFSKMSSDTGKAMKEVANAMKTMTVPSSSDIHLENSKTEVENLKCLLLSEMWKDVEVVQVIEIGIVASLLMDIVFCVESIVKSVHELALLAEFKSIGSIGDGEMPEKSQAES